MADAQGRDTRASDVGEPVVRVVDLHRRFRNAAGDVAVLRGLELSVVSGELVTLSGRSGSGKSSLLAVLCGFDSPDSGTVLLDGVPISMAPAAPSWETCAVLPQALGLATELTIEENVALPLRLHPRPRPTPGEIATRVRDLLDELGIGELAGRYPTEVSFGQQQRVALARAVSGKPKIVLADEPTAHLDSASTPAVLRLLRRCADDGAAVIIATHDDAVHRIADRRVRLLDGVLTALPA
jgi:ABC-type lipoprotein export system ATPase subunit